MNIDNIHKIELEITSDCNAACPGCARTQNLDILDIDSFGVADIKRLFPNERYIKDKQFKFCGVLGDPALNKECVDMVEYLSTQGGFCQLSTNGAYQTADWWRKLGELSKQTKNVEVNFCVDGHKETNHIYRVNTNWKVLDRNMQAYSEGGEGLAKATWIFIVFDHNEYELEAARQHAKDLNFSFATRTGMRNSYHDWVAEIKKKDKEKKALVTEEKTITTTGNKAHSQLEKVRELDSFIQEYTGQKITKSTNKSTGPSRKPIVVPKPPKIEPELVAKAREEILPTIKCKLIHEGEIFISAKQEMWPCCFLSDSAFKNKENILGKLQMYQTGWNSLKDKSIDEVLQHPWFDKILGESWSPDHIQHLPRCIRTCAYNKAYHNEIKVEE